MHWSRSRSALLLLASIGLATTAAAQNLGFLHDAPISRFDKEDMRLHNQAAREALDAPELGKPVTWRNPKTGNSGSVTAVAGKRDACRALTVETQATAIGSATNRYHLCKIDGKWKAEKT